MLASRFFSYAEMFVETAVRWWVSEAASAQESSGDSLNLYSAAYGWQQIDQIQSQSDDCCHGLCFYVIF